MALTRLLPEQTAKLWPEIKPVVFKALPPTATETRDGMLSILSSFITGRLHCWIITNDETNAITGILTTAVIPEPITNQRSLLIYTISTVDGGELRAVIRDFQRLVEFAKSVGCEKIMAYTANPRVSSLMKRLGWDVSFTLGTYSIY